MSTYTLTTRRRTAVTSGLDLGPVLVSELPPAPPARPSFWSRLRDELLARRDTRSFERAVQYAGPAEYGDLLAARRRD